MKYVILDENLLLYKSSLGYNLRKKDECIILKNMVDQNVK